MVSTYCKTDSYIDDLLRDALKYGERMTKECPSSYYEMMGRLFSMFGLACTAAGELYYQEKASKRTLLTIKSLDYHRRLASFKALNESLKEVLCSVPLFRNRNFLKYPQVTVDQILTVKEELLPLEILPNCGDGNAKDLYFNATDLAYKMFDMIFLGLQGIIKFLQSMYDNQQMLQANPEMRVQQWQQMMDDYREKDWKDDKSMMQMRLEEHIRQYGNDKASLTMLLNQFDSSATDQILGGAVATLNRHYLNQKGHVTYIYDHRDSLTDEQVNSHLRFIHCRLLLEQEIALCDLRLPAVGAYADLFTCRAAQEMAELLTPAIAKYVDFEHGYQYGAWVKAMTALGLIYADRRNGTAVTRFVNKTFREHLDKTTLFRYLNRDADFEKIRDRYEAILSVVHREMDRVPRFDFLKRAL